MTGFLGTSANLTADLVLVVTIILGVVGTYGAIHAHRKNFSRHCPVMAVAALLNWIPVLIGMVPMWLVILKGSQLLATGTFYTIPIFHGILGGISQLLMTYTVVRMYWIKQLPPKNPLWLMRITITLWILSVIGGIGVYIVSYVIQ